MRALVTGGGGFLGLAIVRRLCQRSGGGDGVASFSRQGYDALEQLGVTQHRGDLTDAAAVHQAVAAAEPEVVFHVAARAGVWGPYSAYHGPNVLGTQHVIEACRQHGVPRLVFTSSPSVVFDGGGDEGADERKPYPARYLAHYPRTKAEAEQRVLAANELGKLLTVALRPHLIWGPGDPHLVPRVIERADSGRLRLVGDGEGWVDATYIDNAADAHLCAADALSQAEPKGAGKAYFIANDEPMPMRALLNRILAAADRPEVTRRVPPWLAYAAGGVLESVYAALGRRDEPPMTRFVARQLATPHYYDLSAAKRDLGYHPAVSTDEGMQRLAASLRA